MALSAHKGSFAASTSTGDQVVSFTPAGGSFTPKVVIFWGVQLTAAGYGAGLSMSYGCATSATARWAMTHYSLDAAASSDTARGQTSSGVIRFFSDATPTQESKADLVSFGSDTFTINWSDAPASAWLIHYFALGGTDITNAKAGVFNGPGVAGNQAVTDPGFTPNVVLIGDSQIHPVNTDGANGQFNLGAFTSTAQVSTSWRDRDARATMWSASSQRSDRAITTFAGTSDALADEATFVSFDANGFTLNYSVTSGAENCNYLAIACSNVAVGVETSKTSTGTKATSGLGFQPTALLGWSWGLAASAVVDSSQAKLSIGAASAAGTEGGIWVEADDNVADSAVDSRTYTDKFIGLSAQPSTTTSEADLSSFDSGGFTLDWTTADATAREFAYIVLGPAAAAAATPRMLASTGVGT